MDAEAVKQSLEDSGLRCTPQRYAVTSFLMDHSGHPTAAEIFEAVNRLDPRSSRATIYKSLRDLVQAGLVREVAVEGRAARFDAERHPASPLHLRSAAAMLRTWNGTTCPSRPRAPSVKEFFVNANSLSAGSAPSAHRGTVPVKYRLTNSKDSGTWKPILLLPQQGPVDPEKQQQIYYPHRRRMPGSAGARRHTVAGAPTNAGWWPEQLNLKILHQTLRSV